MWAERDRVEQLLESGAGEAHRADYLGAGMPAFPSVSRHSQAAALRLMRRMRVASSMVGDSVELSVSVADSGRPRSSRYGRT
jgi:hypothetical protein